MDEDEFWAGDLMPLAFVEVPQLQCAAHPEPCEAATAEHAPVVKSPAILLLALVAYQ